MESKHTFVVLPFTPALLADPTAIIPVIYRAALHSISSCTIIFSTPSPSAAQLYATIRQSPRRYWHHFQSFLGRVYAALAAGQWEAKRVLMDVEVRFDGERGRWSDKLAYTEQDGDKRLVLLDGMYQVRIPASCSCVDPGLGVECDQTLTPHLTGYETLPCLIDIRDALGEFATYVHPSPPSTAFDGDVSTTDPTMSSTSLDRNSRDDPDGNDAPFPVVALGGTFDHLHAAHKLLLHLALLVAGRKLIVGLMADHLLSSKKNCELVEPLAQRKRRVYDFLRRCDSVSAEETELELDVVEIQDPYGPTAWDPDIHALVVSKETFSGGTAVNTKRRQQGLGELQVFVIDVIASDLDIQGQEAITREVDEGKLKEMKMGSTAIRQWIKDHESSPDRVET